MDAASPLRGANPSVQSDLRKMKELAWADRGATWWLETRWGRPDTQDDRNRQMTERLAAGPPKS